MVTVVVVVVIWWLRGVCDEVVCRGPWRVELAWKETRKVGECSSGPFFALGIESVPKVTF
jgi:hypothetical protein